MKVRYLKILSTVALLLGSARAQLPYAYAQVVNHPEVGVGFLGDHLVGKVGLGYLLAQSETNGVKINESGLNIRGSVGYGRDVIDVRLSGLVYAAVGTYSKSVDDTLGTPTVSDKSQNIGLDVEITKVFLDKFIVGVNLNILDLYLREDNLVVSRLTPGILLGFGF